MHRSVCIGVYVCNTYSPGLVYGFIFWRRVHHASTPRFAWSTNRLAYPHTYGTMAKSQALKLSALKQNVDYPVANKLVDKRCLIHVKLTESCLGAIEGLMNSDKVSLYCTFI